MSRLCQVEHALSPDEATKSIELSSVDKRIAAKEEKKEKEEEGVLTKLHNIRLEYQCCWNKVWHELKITECLSQNFIFHDSTSKAS